MSAERWCGSLEHSSLSRTEQESAITFIFVGWKQTVGRNWLGIVLLVLTAVRFESPQIHVVFLELLPICCDVYLLFETTQCAV
jgi:hypothetical protein